MSVMLRRKLAVLALCLGVGVLGACGPKRPPAAEEAAATTEATPVVVTTAMTGDMQEAETLTGSVEPLHEVEVQSEIAGSVAWVGYDVGDRVARGAALVRLDTALAGAGEKQATATEQAARARHSQARVGLQLAGEETSVAVLQTEKSLENARTRLRQAKLNAELTRSRVENDIARAKIEVSSARTRLAEVKAGSRSQELAQAQARLDQARAALRLAKANLTRVQSLAQAGAVAAAQLDAAEVEYESAQSQVRVAEQALDLAKEGARSEQTRLAELGVSQAEQALAQAEAQRGQAEVAEREVRNAEVAVAQAEDQLRLVRSQRQRVRSTEEEVKAAAASVQQARAGVTYSRTTVRKHTVYAPLSGVIAARMVEPGESASTSTALMRLVALDQVRIVAEASDLQVGKMRVGQPAALRVDSLPGEQFVGRIADIAPQSQPGQRVFLVRIIVQNPGHRLRAGMFARVEIVTGLRQNAVVISRDALVERGAKRVVYAVEKGAVKVREVIVGAIDGPRVEVRRGLKSGAVLVLGGQSLLADGQPVKPVETATGSGAAASPAPSP